MRTLIQISEDLLALVALTEEMLGPDGGVPDEFVSTLESWWSEITEDNLHPKIDNYCALIRSLDLRASVRQAEIDRMEKLVKYDENLAKHLRDRLLGFLMANPHVGKRIDTARYSVSLCANGGLPPMTILVEPKDLPQEFQETVIKANTAKIRECLKEAPGHATEFARLDAPGHHVRIR